MRILKNTLIQAIESALEQEQSQDRTVSPNYKSGFTRTMESVLKALNSGETLEVIDD